MRRPLMRTRRAGDEGGAGFRSRWPARRWVVAAALPAAVALGVGGMALAAIPDSTTGVFHGCYSTRTGALRLVDPATHQGCHTGEKAVSWNQGITWRGNWNRSTSYEALDAVAYGGSSYAANTAGKGRIPTTNPVFRSPLVQAGSRGAAGAQGPPGSPGGGGLLPGQLTLGTGVPVVLSRGRYGFSVPEQVAFDGSHLWITDSAGNSVTAIQR